MRATGFGYSVNVVVEFNEAEVDRLIDCSQHHYDSKCRSLGRQGGFLFGMKNEFLMEDIPSEKGTWTLSLSDLNILAKIIENPRNPAEMNLQIEISRLFNAARDKGNAVNAAEENTDVG